MVVIGKPNVVKSVRKLKVHVRDMTISSSDSCECLGLIIDSELSWTQHVSRLTRNCNSVLWSMYPIQNLITQANRKILLDSYFISKIRYMCPLWGVCSNAILKTCLRHSACGLMPTAGFTYLPAAWDQKVRSALLLLLEHYIVTHLHNGLYCMKFIKEFR